MKYVLYRALDDAPEELFEVFVATGDFSVVAKAIPEIQQRFDRSALYESALWDIAHMNREPRLDGTYNYSREAIIDTARRALEEGNG